jgi:D-alanyl-D-alanine carboxypeptidase/D-alanyl-D-alanine-endopeptidase (penicillin-binding protein 4)|tara:strand:+ start:2115 stop:3602 length:1488 start_codon:yes stop_codon:yes gene_type:complete
MPYVLKVCFNTNSINILVTQRSYQETSMLTHLVNIIFLLFLLSSVSVQATTLTVDGLANKNTPKATDVAFHLIDMKTGKTLIAQREDQLQPPASLQKLVTALAAKLYLKDDFRFVTRLERNKEDVIIRFSGDPNFSSDDLDGLFKTLRANQSVIKGNLYINGAAFDDYERAIGLPWDNLGVCYSAPSSSISIDKNCAMGNLYVKPGASKAQVLLSAKKPINIDTSSLQIIKTNVSDDDYCQMKLLADEQNHYQIGGCINEASLPVKLKFALQNTTAYAKSSIEEALNKAGIQLKGKIIRDDNKNGAVITEHQSAPLDALVRQMLKRSDNLIADNILKTIGHQFYKQSGSYENGIAALQHILKQQANIDLSHAMLVDGSGLSRNNRLSASQLIQVVSYIFKHPELGLISDLPVSGESGTLAFRSSVNKPPLKGQIQAKTGTLYGTYNLAGKIRTKSNRDLLFVQIVTNFHPADEKQSRWPVMKFEKSLYESIYQRF